MKMTPRGSWPAGLLGMFALVLGVERYVSRHDAQFTTAIIAAWKQSGAAVARAARCDVVCLGDSLVKHGVVSPVLAERLGRSVYNLAVPKGQAPGNYFLLKRLLDSGAKPSAVLVDGELLEIDPKEMTRAWPEMLTLSECARFAFETRDPAMLGALTLARALPSYRTRSEVRLSIQSAFAGKVPEEPQSVPVLIRNWKRNGGAHLMPPLDLSAGDPRPRLLEQSNYRPSVWACHPTNADYLDKMLDLADAHGIPVFWLMPPYHPEVQVRRSRYGWEASYLRFVQGLRDRHPRLTVVDGRHANYPAEVLADMTHLDRVGALAFSEALGSLLRDRLASPDAQPGWIELPPYRAGAWEALASSRVVEDTRQSGEALTRVMAEVRSRRHAGLGGSGEDRRRR